MFACPAGFSFWPDLPGKPVGFASVEEVALKSLYVQFHRKFSKSPWHQTAAFIDSVSLLFPFNVFGQKCGSSPSPSRVLSLSLRKPNVYCYFSNQKENMTKRKTFFLAFPMSWSIVNRNKTARVKIFYCAKENNNSDCTILNNNSAVFWKICVVVYKTICSLFSEQILNS